MISQTEMRLRLLATIQKVGGQSAFARRCGVSRAYVSDLARTPPRRDPGPKILKVLKLKRIERREVGYEEL